MWRLGRLLTVFRKELLLVWAMLRDPRAPWAAKATAIAAILYVLSPVDFVSDFIPVLGWLDDGLVAYVLVQLALRLLPADVHTALRTRINERAAPRRAAPGTF